MNRRKMLSGMGAAAVIAATTGGALAFAPAGEETVGEFISTFDEIICYRAAMTSMQHIHFDRQVRLYLAGEPNRIKGDGDFTYEKFAAGFTPDCINWINAGCPKGWRGPDKIQAGRLARRRERRRQKAVTA